MGHSGVGMDGGQDVVKDAVPRGFFGELGRKRSEMQWVGSGNCGRRRAVASSIGAIERVRQGGCRVWRTVMSAKPGKVVWEARVSSSGYGVLGGVLSLEAEVSGVAGGGAGCVSDGLVAGGWEALFPCRSAAAFNSSSCLAFSAAASASVT